MNVLIANHKSEQANQLKYLLKQHQPLVNIIDITSSIRETINSLQEKKLEIDLAFIHTRLSDGNIFQLKQNFQTELPLIFTSDSTEDAFRAFKASALDYLLYPLNESEIIESLRRLAKQQTFYTPKRDLSIKYKKRLMVKLGDKLQFKQVNDIAYFFAEGKIVYVVSKENQRKYIVEHTLEELQSKYLHPDYFFRINRKYLVHINAILEVRPYVNSRLKLFLAQNTEQNMIVSREKVSAFKAWLNL